MCYRFDRQMLNTRFYFSFSSILTIWQQLWELWHKKFSNLPHIFIRVNNRREFTSNKNIEAKFSALPFNSSYLRHMINTGNIFKKMLNLLNWFNFCFVHSLRNNNISINHFHEFSLELIFIRRVNIKMNGFLFLSKCFGLASWSFFGSYVTVSRDPYFRNFKNTL